MMLEGYTNKQKHTYIVLMHGGSDYKNKSISLCGNSLKGV